MSSEPLSLSGRISSPEDAQRWQAALLDIASDSFELRLFRSWLDRYVAHGGKDIEPAGTAELVAKNVGALVVPFSVSAERFYLANSQDRDVPPGLGWFIGHQSVHSDASGQRPTAWVMGCELQELSAAIAPSSTAINGLVSVFEAHSLRGRGGLLYLTRNSSGALNEALQSAGLTSNGILGGVHAVADEGSSSVDLIPEKTPVNAYIFEKE